MTLQNLAKIGQLKPHSATGEEVQRLLAAVRRNLADAGRAGNSIETRFDCAYKAIMQCALVAMMASGYRPSTSAPAGGGAGAVSVDRGGLERQRGGHLMQRQWQVAKPNLGTIEPNLGVRCRHAYCRIAEAEGRGQARAATGQPC
jgi:hypothetical protein